MLRISCRSRSKETLDHPAVRKDDPILLHPGLGVDSGFFPVERFGRSVEGITVFTSAGRFHAAQVVTLSARRPELSYVRELRLAWSVDGAPDASAEPGYSALGQRSWGRRFISIGHAKRASSFS